MARQSSLLGRVTLSLGSLLVSLLLIELYLREEVAFVVQQGATTASSFEADPEFLVTTSSRGRRYVPNARVVIRNHYLSQRDIELHINSLGLRHRELSSPKPEGEKRILVLGDSITAADSVPDQETFVRIAERSLHQVHVPSVQVINAGIANVGITEEVNLFEDLAPQVQPDLVVLAFYLNDSRPPWGFAGEIGDRGWIRRHSILVDTLFVRLQQYRWIQTHARRHLEWVPSAARLPWRTSKDAFAELVAQARYDWGSAWLEESWDVVRRELTRLHSLTDSAKIPLVIVAFPVLFQLESEFEDTAPQTELKKIAHAIDVPVFDLYPILRSAEASALFYDHCHPNPAGHRVIADAITPFLGAQLNAIL